MSGDSAKVRGADAMEAVAQLREAAAAAKCWSCGCLHSSIKAIERAIPQESFPADLHVERSAPF